VFWVESLPECGQRGHAVRLLPARSQELIGAGFGRSPKVVHRGHPRRRCDEGELGIEQEGTRPKTGGFIHLKSAVKLLASLVVAKKETMPMADRYTKIVLTVIAACLVVIAFRGEPVTTAYAQSLRGPVTVVGRVHVIIDGVAQGLAVPVRMMQER
jgi:hypothetical protein